MTGVLYPIASSPEGALAAPLGRAGLLSAAQAQVGSPLSFARELAGPAYETREAAAAAYRGRLDDERTIVQPQDRYCDIQPVRSGQGRGARTVWRLCVGYWKVGEARASAAVQQARRARRRQEGRSLAPDTLEAMTQLPLRPDQPQKALDIGLFEVRLPENPAVIIPDE